MTRYLMLFDGVKAFCFKPVNPCQRQALAHTLEKEVVWWTQQKEKHVKKMPQKFVLWNIKQQFKKQLNKFS